MSNRINIRHNFPDVAKRLDVLSDEIGSKALVRALNTTIDQGKTQMARQISQEFRIGSAKVKERLAVTKASAKSGTIRFEAKLEATQRGKGRSMNVITFVSTLPRKLKSGKKTEVKFQIKRSGGKKILPGAFIGNKNRTMFRRVGPSRLPIVPVNTVDVPQMFNTRRINEAVRKVMLQRFDATFKRELRSILKGFVK